MGVMLSCGTRKPNAAGRRSRHAGMRARHFYATDLSRSHADPTPLRCGTGAQWEELEEVGRVTSHSYSGGQGEALVGEDFHVGLASHSSYHALNEQMTGKHPPWGSNPRPQG